MYVCICIYQIHTKRRNRLKQETMNDVVYVMVNSKLTEKKEGGIRSLQEFEFDNISSDDEWIMENVEGGEDNENINLNDNPCLLYTSPSPRD